MALLLSLFFHTLLYSLQFKASPFYKKFYKVNIHIHYLYELYIIYILIQ